MSKIRAMTLMAVLALGTTGCQGLAGPNWFAPGPAEYQQARAQRFDPYPENEAGPPVVGARPRGYEKPLPEVDRARWSTTSNVRGWRVWPWNWTQ